MESHVPHVHHPQSPKQGKSRRDTGYDRTPPPQVWLVPYLLLEARRVGSFVEETPTPSSCITGKIENPDFPLRVWKIQKEGGSRLTESVSQDKRMP